MISCPNKGSQDWKNLVQQVGVNKAYLLWTEYDGNVPKEFIESNTIESINDSVKTLRRQELLELREQVKNYASFITNGSVDSKKIKASNNLKAKEIYDKYDKLISPLLNKDNNVVFQLDSAREKTNIKELDDFLIKYLKQFNVKFKELEDLKSRLGVNALGATDTLNKLIWFAKNRNEETVPEESAHMALILMGNKHPDVSELLANIQNWQEYSSVYDEYMPIYKDEEKVKVEAAAKLIAKSLVKNYKVNGLNLNLIGSAIQAIKDFINKILNSKEFSSIFLYNEYVADHIALNLLSGNKDYIRKITNLNPNLNPEKELNSNPLAKSIINIFGGKNSKVTGSLAIAAHGENIRRPEGEGIHDIDFRVNSFDHFEKVILPELNKLNFTPAHYGWHKKDYSTYAYLIAEKGLTINVIERKDDFSNGWITDYNLTNSKGEIVPSTQKNVVGVDFFVYKTDLSNEFETNSVFSPSSAVYEGKMSLGGKSSPFFFSREKDQEDYVLRNPNSFIRYEPSVFFQENNSSTATASKETLEKVQNVLKKMGVSVTSLQEYAKANPSINVTSANGIADLVKGIIGIAEGKEDVALTEEMVHFATAIIEQVNPKMITELISKIANFPIYKEVLEKYKNNKNYQLSDGRPDIRKIKKEAVDKLITDIIINNNVGNVMPNMSQAESNNIIAILWNKILDAIRSLYQKSNLDIFEKAANEIIEGNFEGDIFDIKDGGVYYQLSDKQKVLQEKIIKTRNLIEKRDSTEDPNPMLSDDNSSSNYYEIKNEDGTFTKIVNRVTDRVKAYYFSKFRNKTFTEQEKIFNDFKRDNGIKYHEMFETIHARYFTQDGIKRARPLNKTKRYIPLEEAIYTKLETYFVDLVAKTTIDGIAPIVLSESIIYDAKYKKGEAGTLDLLLIDKNGKAHIIDWKFMSVAPGSKDIAWFKQGAFNIQLERYKSILRDSYGVKEFGMTRAIPILMDIKKPNPLIKNSSYAIRGISIGSVNPTDIEDLTLIPVSAETESTGIEQLDVIIQKLNSLWRTINEQNVNNEQERDEKSMRMNTVKTAIRAAQSSLNILPLVNVILDIKLEGDTLINDYKILYENKSASDKDITNKDLSDFSENLREHIAISEIFGNVGDTIGDLIYNSSMDKLVKTEEDRENIRLRKDLLLKITEETKAIRKNRNTVKQISNDFADKFIGQRNLVSGLLAPEAVIQGFSSWFHRTSEIPLASMQILYKIVTNAKDRSVRKANEQADILLEIRDRIVKRGGNTRELLNKIYQKNDKNNFVNKIVNKYTKEFYEAASKNAEEGARSKQWIADNINMTTYTIEARKVLNDKIAYIKKNNKLDAIQKDEMIYEEIRKWDVSKSDFNGWNNFILKRHPKDIWLSEEYKEIVKDKDLFDLYNYVIKINDQATEAGYISNKVSATFLPFIKKGMAESFIWDGSLSAISKIGDSISLKAEDSGFGKINEITKDLEFGLPKYFTYDFTKQEDGTIDTSEVSEDLFKNILLYTAHVNKYEQFSQIEGQLKLVQTIETFKDHFKTTRLGNVVIKNGIPEKVLGNEENSKLFETFLRGVLYEQKYPLSESDTEINIGVLNFVKKTVNKLRKKEVFKINDNPSGISLVKSMDTLNRAFQLKTLGFDIITGTVNSFGMNVQLSAQGGNYFKYREVLNNERKLIGNNFKSDDERKMLLQLIETFMPLKDSPLYEKIKTSGLSAFTQFNFGELLMVFMRNPEQLIEKAVFITLLENTMMEKGNLVNIREFVKSQNKDRYKNASANKEFLSNFENQVSELKKTRSLFSTKKLVNGKLEIEGFDLNNIDQLQKLSNLTKIITNNSTGGKSDIDKNRSSMHIWFNSLMVFKNWIPPLLNTRFSEFRKISDDFSVIIDENGNTTGEKFDVGRVRLWWYVIASSLRDQTSNVYNILTTNEKGLEALNTMFEDFKDKYETRTGQELTMSKEDFMDMIKTNLRNQMKEVLLLVSIIGLTFSMGYFEPDDDSDKATKNTYRYAKRALDKFQSEISFFYDPREFDRMLSSGGILPAISLFSELSRFITDLTMETTGLDISNLDKTSEEVRKSAQPIKKLGKMLPITRSIFTYAPLFSEEFAKEYDITVQEKARQ